MYSIEYLHAMQMFDIYLKIFGNYVTFLASLFKPWVRKIQSPELNVTTKKQYVKETFWVHNENLI